MADEHALKLCIYICFNVFTRKKCTKGYILADFGRFRGICTFHIHLFQSNSSQTPACSWYQNVKQKCEGFLSRGLLV